MSQSIIIIIIINTDVFDETDNTSLFVSCARDLCHQSLTLQPAVPLKSPVALLPVAVGGGGIFVLIEEESTG